MIHVTTGQNKFYGTFYDTTIQTALSASTAYAMKFNTTDLSNGVTVTSGSQINIINSGTYNIQFSAQFDKTNASPKDFWVWLAKNGSSGYAWSNTEITMAGSNRGVAAWNFVETFVGGDHFHLFWLTEDTNIKILSASAPGHGMPEIPSIILTVTQV